MPFLHATAATAVAHLSHRNSVCPSVCLSHVWICQKWCELGYLAAGHLALSGDCKFFLLGFQRCTAVARFPLR